MYNYLNTEQNREMSKLIHEKGCVSDSGRFWYTGGKLSEWNPWLLVDAEHKRKKAGNIYAANTAFLWLPAFTFEDVINPENAKRIWGEDCNNCNGSMFQCNPTHLPRYIFYSRFVLDIYQFGDDWQKYVINALKK